MRKILVLCTLFALCVGTAAAQQSIDIRLQGSDGAPAGSGEVVVQRVDQPDEIIRGQLDQNGAVELPVPAAGIYRVTVRRNIESPLIESGEYSRPIGTSDYIRVASGERIQQSFLADDLPSVSVSDWHRLFDLGLEAKRNCDEVTYRQVVDEIQRALAAQLLAIERNQQFIPDIRENALSLLEENQRNALRSGIDNAVGIHAKVQVISAEIARLQELVEALSQTDVVDRAKYQELNVAYHRVWNVYAH